MLKADSTLEVSAIIIRSCFLILSKETKNDNFLLESKDVKEDVILKPLFRRAKKVFLPRRLFFKKRGYNKVAPFFPGFFCFFAPFVPLIKQFCHACKNGKKLQHKNEKFAPFIKKRRLCHARKSPSQLRPLLSCKKCTTSEARRFPCLHFVGSHINRIA